MKAISVESMRALDARTIGAGIPGRVLMGRAGEAAFAALRQALYGRLGAGQRQRYLVVAGKGNNGGDAYVVARCLADAGECVSLVAVCPPSALDDDARYHASRLPATVPVAVGDSLPTGALTPGTIVIDGLLGTGISGPPRAPYDSLIEQINASGLPVVSLDIPSGLAGDAGSAPGACINATLTLTIAQPKQGMLTPEGLARCGCLRCVDIGIPAGFVDETPGWFAEALLAQDVQGLVARRPRDCHKGSFGHVLIAAGSRRYSGAPFLAADGATRSGAGLVTVAVPMGCVPSCSVRASHIVCSVPSEGDGWFGPSSVDVLTDLAPRYSAVVYGPGIGPEPDGLAALEALVGSDTPLVLDADGLRRLAERPDLTKTRTAAMILTPHPGEMLPLLQAFGVAESDAEDRFSQARSLAVASGCLIVLKGLGTVIAAPDGRLAVNTSGTAALATAGSGDVLAGMIGALMAQGLEPWNAGCLGVFAHGLAAEHWIGAERSMTADDLIECLPQAWLSLAPGA